MNNYENNHHDGIAPIEPVFENSLEANLNNDNISIVYQKLIDFTIKF